MNWSTPNATITVAAAAEAETYLVEVRGPTMTTHRVTVSPVYLLELGTGGHPVERVLREAFGFLLEREPNTSILSRFDLREIEGYFPEFRREIARRLGA
jgi:hypothetical protein